MMQAMEKIARDHHITERAVASSMRVQRNADLGPVDYGEATAAT
jgi:hypothetical protein